jgi:glycosyltransferase involved in cell wall biosynthesis
MDIMGHFTSEIGLGESARLYWHAAHSAGIDATAVDMPLAGRTHLRDFDVILSDAPAHDIGLTIQGLPGFARSEKRLCRLRRNVALPYWELEALPAGAVRDLARYDEVWAPSSFLKALLDDALGRTTILVPQPVLVPDFPPKPRPATGPLRILFFFDFDSFMARKNPHAAIAAFQRAFRRSEDVTLTVKVRGGNDRGGRAWLAREASADPRIQIVDRTLTVQEMTELLERCDVFLSLHRSEGFGFGCAQALAAGKTVVSTDYGGTTDFVTPETGYPVAWRRVPVAAGDYIEAANASWADPDIDHAAALLRRIYDDPSEGRRRAAAGAMLLRKTHSPNAVGARILSHLEPNRRASVP